MTSKKVHVMVVDDSMVARSMIIRGLSAHPSIEVIGYAINTLDAKVKIPKLNPDVITMDVEMPGKSGIDFLKEYLPQHPIPVILVSSLNLKVFDALDAGAVDFVRKPASQDNMDAFVTTLTQKVLIASAAKVRSTPATAGTSPTQAAAGRHSGHGHCAAYAARLYQNVC